MFEQIIAIDIDERIPNCSQRLSALSKARPLFGQMADDVLSRAPKNTDALLVSIHQSLSEDLLDRFSHLRYVGVLGTSLKKIPLDYCRTRSITVTNVTEYCDQDTAEWVMMKLLQFFRGRTPPMSARAKILGVVGVGAVGRHVIHLAQAFEMKIIYNAQKRHQDLEDSGIKFATKEEIFSCSDVVSVHTPPFFEWLSRDLLQASRKNLCVINTCMGRISPNNDLGDGLYARPDVTIIMDKIAGDHYPELNDRAQIFNESAFATVDARNLLVEKFLANILLAL